MELDDKVTLAGPEGIDLDLVLAGIMSRAGALLLDTLIQIVIIWVAGLAAEGFPDESIAVVAIATFLAVFGYPIAMEAFNGGRTLGKMALGIAVVRDDGTPVTFLAATIRNVVRLVDLLPGLYTVGLVAALVTKRTQRLGDLVAGTLVVRRNRQQAPVGGLAPAGPGPWFGPPPQAPAEIATWDTSALTADELAAVRAFLDRRSQLDLLHRNQIGQALATQLLPKVAGIPLDGGPELFLERIAYARSFR